MNLADTPETNATLRAFQDAWEDAIEDYAKRRLNSEHCLQAALYAGLRRRLPDEYRVFVEAVALLCESDVEETGKSKVVVDLLVCHHSNLVAGIELKFTPRGEPSTESVKKDVLSLSRLTNRKRIADRAVLEMPRYRHAEDGALTLRILPQRKLIFGIFCSDEATPFSDDTFWSIHRPNTGYWQGVSASPRNLAVAVARADERGHARGEYFGAPFARLADSGQT